MANFDYQGAISEGYTDEEISNVLQQKYPKFKYKEAVESGYSPSEVNEFLSSYKEPKTLLQQVGRTAGQFALGTAEAAAIPYELAAAPLASKEAQQVEFRANLGSDLERLLEQKQTGVFDEADEALLNSIIEQIKDPRKSEEFIQTADLSLQGLTEKATGVDLTPEGALEKGSRWIGWIKDPKNLTTLAKDGISPKEIAKAVMPSKTEAFKGLAAGTALEIAEDGGVGPIGQIAAGIVADAIAGKGADLLKKGTKLLTTQPKKLAAEVAASFTKNDKKQLQQSIINDFRQSGIQADLGTITDNNIIKWTQARLSQSGLTGEALDNMKTNLTNQIKSEYKSIAKELGDYKFTNTFEAGEAAKDMISRVRERDLNEVRGIYSAADNALTKDSKVFTDKLSKSVNSLEKKLKPGAIKSAEQKAVLDSVKKLKSDLLKTHPKGKTALVKDLINNKVALNDIINYEVQGGAKQLLKGLVADLDRAIISHGVENSKFARKYVDANKRFSQHAKTFRNKNISQILRLQDPAQAMSKMNNVQGIRDVKKALSGTSEGRKLFEDLKRFKLEQVIGDNMIDGVTKQVKLGTFANLLDKGKNREIIKEILSGKDFRKLERLQNNSGVLAESAQKFFNASKSGVVAADAAVLVQVIRGLGSLLHGNPWPLINVLGTVEGGRKLAGLISDPEFLRLTEEAIINSKKTKDPAAIKKSFDALEEMIPYALAIMQEIKESNIY